MGIPGVTAVIPKAVTVGEFKLVSVKATVTDAADVAPAAAVPERIQVGPLGVVGTRVRALGRPVAVQAESTVPAHVKVLDDRGAPLYTVNGAVAAALVLVSVQEQETAPRQKTSIHWS